MRCFLVMVAYLWCASHSLSSGKEELDSELHRGFEHVEKKGTGHISTKTFDWSNTSVLFYGDVTVWRGYTQQAGYIQMFTTELSETVQKYVRSKLDDETGIVRENSSSLNMGSTESENETIVGPGDVKLEGNPNIQSQFTTIERVEKRPLGSIELTRPPLMKSKVPMWKIKELNLSIPTDTWNEVHVETRDHMQHGFYGLLESLRSWHPTVLIVQFGMSDVLIDAEPSDNFAYYRLESFFNESLFFSSLFSSL